MCLSEITERYSPFQKGVKHGYKVMEAIEDKFGFPYLTGIGVSDDEGNIEYGKRPGPCGMEGVACRCLKINTWYTACVQVLVVPNFFGGGEVYPSGFHIFPSLEDAIAYLGCNLGTSYYKVVEVEYDEVSTIGKQGNLTTVVANRMKVIGTP